MSFIYELTKTSRRDETFSLYIFGIYALYKYKFKNKKKHLKFIIDGLIQYSDENLDYVSRSLSEPQIK
jgi:hypothetical protein